MVDNYTFASGITDLGRLEGLLGCPSKAIDLIIINYIPDKVFLLVAGPRSLARPAYEFELLSKLSMKS